MNKKTLSALILGGFLAVFSATAFTIWSNETILANGKKVILPLAPVDPRSLMQGDYMALSYQLARDGRAAFNENTAQKDGFLIVQLDENNVAELKTIAEKIPKTLEKNEAAIYFRVRNRELKIATNAFFFQEGTAEIYEKARFGEFRVSEKGEPRLVAMLDENLKLLGENKR